MIPSTQKWARHYKGWCSRQVMLHRNTHSTKMSRRRETRVATAGGGFLRGTVGLITIFNKRLVTLNAANRLLWMLSKVQCTFRAGFVKKAARSLWFRVLCYHLQEGSMIHFKMALSFMTPGLVQRLLSVPRCNPVLEVVRRLNYYHGSKRMID